MLFKGLERRIAEKLRAQIEEELKTTAYETAFRDGFAKGFDFALALHAERYQDHLAKMISDSREAERKRYDIALEKLEKLKEGGKNRA